MQFLERELEDFLFEMIEEYSEDLADRGFKVGSKEDGWSFYRQLNLGKWGIADIIGIRCETLENGKVKVNIHVIELKKDQINVIIKHLLVA